MSVRCAFYIKEDSERYQGALDDNCYISEEDCNDIIDGDNVWHCPRRAVSREDYCPLHTKDESSPVSASKAFLNTLSGKMYNELPLEERFSFHGGTFFSFSYYRGIMEGENGAVIGLKHCEFYGEMSWENLNVESNLDFSGSNFYRKVNFDHVSCQSIKFTGCTFFDEVGSTLFSSEQIINLSDCDFLAEVNLSSSDFDTLLINSSIFRNKAIFISLSTSSLSFIWSTQFEGLAHFSHAKFDSVMFDHSSFDGVVSFDKATFSDDAKFTDVLFGEYVSFNDAEFAEDAVFTNSSMSFCTFVNTQFSGETLFRVEVEELDSNERDHSLFNSMAQFDGARFTSKPDFRTLVGPEDEQEATAKIPTFRSHVTFKQAVFRRGGEFSNTTIENLGKVIIDFTNAELEHVDFSESTLNGADFSDANLTDANLIQNALIAANFERANLTRTNLFDSILFGAKLYSAILSDTQINDETMFGHHYKNINSSEEVGESELQMAMWSFRAVERLSNNNALPSQARDMYRSRKNAKRLLEKVRGNRWRYYRAEVSRYAWGYGTSLKQIGFLSTSVILSFGILYPFIGGVGGPNSISATYVFDIGDSHVTPLPRSATVLLNSIYFSIVTFTTLGYGDLQPASLPVRITAGVESLIGNLLLAAVIFVLGRRATR